jgi:glycerophosphoryl diester phosphodiesterase
MPEVTTRSLRRVGHKGADLIAPGNTPASFDAALAAGVDMIEFDILPEDPRDPRGSRLVLAHDYNGDLRTAPTLQEGLAHLAGAAFAGIELDADLKLPGYEDRVVDALREHGLVERTLASTMEKESLPRLRALEPGLRLGWSVPKSRRDYTQSRLWKGPAAGALAYGRAILPSRAAQAIRTGFCDAIMAYWRLVTPRLIAEVEAAGGEVYVWTVDDPRHIGRFAAMGATGVITNDPRLFATEPAPS